MTPAQKALLEIYGPHMDRTHTTAFMEGWKAAIAAVLQAVSGGISDPEEIAGKLTELMQPEK